MRLRMESLRTVVGLAVRNSLSLHQLDITTYYFSQWEFGGGGVHATSGRIHGGNEYLVCRLECSIYGLKQSSSCWNSIINSHLKQLGFLQSNSDLCVYIAAVQS